MERRVCVRGIISDNNNRLFAIKHKNQDHSESEYWVAPGGGLDVGESLVNGIHREMIEETGIKPVVGKLLFMQKFLFPQHNGVVRESMEFFFHIENIDDYLKDIKLDETTHGSLEISHFEFIDLKGSYILPEFIQHLNIRDYIDNNKPPKIISDLEQLDR